MKNMKRGENMQSGNSEKKGYKVKINIKVKTRGLTKEENSETSTSTYITNSQDLKERKESHISWKQKKAYA